MLKKNEHETGEVRVSAPLLSRERGPTAASRRLAIYLQAGGAAISAWRLRTVYFVSVRLQ